MYFTSICYFDTVSDDGYATPLSFSPFTEPTVTTEHKDDEGSPAKHKDGDSGFETFLMDPNIDVNANSLTSPYCKLEAKQ